MAMQGRKKPSEKARRKSWLLRRSALDDAGRERPVEQEKVEAYSCYLPPILQTYMLLYLIYESVLPGQGV